MMLVRASSTARVMERQSEAEKPSTSVKRSSAPRTTQSSLGSVCNCRFSSTPSLDTGTPSPSGCREGFTVFMCEWGSARVREEHNLEWRKREGCPGGRHLGPVRGISTTLKEDRRELKN